MNKKIIVGIALGFLLITTIGFTYAFFTATVTGNEEAKDQIVETGTLSLVYKDGSELKLESAIPGKSVSKIISVTNTGTLDTNYNMIFKDLINTIENNELVISYTCKSYTNYVDINNKGEISGTCTGITNQVVPLSETISDSIITEGTAIAPGITHEYNVTITFIETGDSQNYNQGKTFSSKINIVDAGNTFTVSGTLTDENGDALSNHTVEIHSTVRSSVTDSDGKFEISDVSSGNHTVKVLNGDSELSSSSIEIKSNSVMYLTLDTTSNTLDVRVAQKSACANNTYPFGTIVHKMLSDNCAFADNVSSPYVTGETGIDFDAISSDTNGKGLYYTTDATNTQNGERVYYYRGEVENNYVIFGEYTTNKIMYYNSATSLEYDTEALCKSANSSGTCSEYKYYKSGDKMCWRIVRTNEDGSIRLRYAGSTDENGYCPQTGENVRIGVSVYNENYNDNAYVGYMYGSFETNSTSYNQAHLNTKNSTIKTVIDNWYRDNIANTNYHSLVANSVYCNDRGVVSTENMPTLTRNGDVFNNMATGFGKDITFYNGMQRFINDTTNDSSNALVSNENHKPTYVCSQNDDSFTLSVTAGGTVGYGNNALSYPVGLLSIDEVVFAGGNVYRSNGSSSNTNYFLRTSSWYWTMTPSLFFGGYARMFFVNPFSHLGVVHNSNVGGAVLPVISLKENVDVLNGSGKYNDPYVIDNSNS